MLRRYSPFWITDSMPKERSIFTMTSPGTGVPAGGLAIDFWANDEVPRRPTNISKRVIERTMMARVLVWMDSMFNGKIRDFIAL